MNLHVASTEKECPRAKLYAYIDGELLPREELELELHLSNCQSCSSELNEQKKLFHALDFALEDEKEVELPADFTKIVVTKAECNVSGLRCSRERFKAFYICLGLFFLVILGLGAEIENFFNTIFKFTGQFFAVCGFLLHLIYDISIGTAVILRSLGNQFVSNSAIFGVFFAVFLLISLFMFSRLFVRFSRA